MSGMSDEANQVPETSAPVAAPVNAEPASQNPVQNPVQNPAPLNQVPMPAMGDQLTKLTQHPAVKGYMGKAIKVVAGFALLGCLLLYVAITALSNLITGALPK